MTVMQRLALFALLTVAILFTGPVQAQRAGGGFHGSGPGMAGGHGFGVAGQSGFRNGSFEHHHGYRRSGDYRLAFASWYYPYWDEGEPLEFYPDPPVNVPSPPVVVVESHNSGLTVPVPESPKLIEVPPATGSARTLKHEPPTLFVLVNGERLEARRYMLTKDSLRVEIGRQLRTVSLGEIDLDATVAANRERGIDLKIPSDRSEIFLGF